MNLHQFRYVREAVRRGLNLTEAAKALHTSQPGVSKAILELEEELGVRIFQRHGKRLRRVTEPGTQVLASIERILQELEKPGRDPRDGMPKPIFKSDVLKMEDLREGMLLKGTVRNVVDFGAFVDIGVKRDGLVHVSEMADRYIKNPLEVVAVGDVISVKVIKVDLERGRVQLSMKI